MAALTQMRVRARFNYDPLTGVLTYRVDVGTKHKVGMVAGCDQYKDIAKTIPNCRLICIDGKNYVATRIIWLWMTGVWLPDNIDIDHRDVNPHNNVWSNLRLATRSNDCANQRKRKTYNGVTSTSQFKGVSWSKASLRNPWTARVIHQGKHYYLGSYPTEIEAHQAYVAAAKRLHGQFARAA